MVYDWSDQETEINWAAFYSDCEHEVYEVTEGHRITLTYNLYAHEQLGGILRNPATVNRESFTFYRCVKEALVSPNFFPKGSCFLLIGSALSVYFDQGAHWDSTAHIATRIRMIGSSVPCRRL